MLAASSAPAGTLEQFFYVPLPGATVADLTLAPEFPEHPFTVTPVNWFHPGLEGITNASTAYGSWLRGYLEAPVSGDYTFYLSADDSAELYLSTDHQAANKELIARVESQVPYGVYDQHRFQRSVAVPLERGRQYYFKVLHKSVGGTDHIQVGWLRPDDVLERPIPLHYVQRFVPASYEGPGVLEPASIPPLIATSPTMGNLVGAVENQRVILAPNVSATPPVYYQWFENGAPLAGENLSSLDLGEVTEADAGRVFTLLAATPEGIALSADWPLQVRNDATAPMIVSAYTSGMTNGFLLTFSEPLDPATATNAANYNLNLGVSVTDVSLLYGTNLNTVVVRTTPFPPAGIPEVTVTGVRDRAQPSNAVAPGTTRAIWPADGSITLRYYGGVFGAEPLGGTSILDLVGSGVGFEPRRFPDQPDLVTTRSEMGIPNNFADNYAAQLIGFLVPPVTGDYRFWIASDDQGILYLSSDADPTNKRAIVVEPQWNGYRAYTTTTRRTMNNTGNSGFIHSHFPNLDPDLPANDSLNTVGPVHLEAGRRYYIEAVMKEGGGGDSLDVAWQMPDGAPVFDGQAPIPGEFLAQWSGSGSGDVVITNQPAGYSATEGRHATFSVGFSGTRPMTYQWFRNGIPIVDADGPVYTFPARLTDQGALYSVRVRNDFSEVWSVEAQLVVWADLAPPRMVRAQADQHFDKVTLRFNEPVTVATATNLANYAISRTDNGQPLEVLSARVSGFQEGGYTNVVVGTGRIEPGVNYTVRTSGITDLSERANATRPEDTANFTGWVLSRGFVLYERWEDVHTGGIDTQPAQYRKNHVPDVSTYLTLFESPQNVAENYYGRISGYFVAPANGRHDFYMACDENGELWIANETGSTLPQTRLAFEPSWGNARSWTGTSDGRRNNGDNNTVSDSLPLLTMAAGEHRYIELLWAEGGGGDYAHATYSGPGEPVPQNGTTSRLRGDVIAAWANPDAVTITITDEPDDLARSEGTTANFSVSATALDWDGVGQPYFFQWQRDGVDIPGANSWTYTTPVLLYRREPYRYRCRVSSVGVQVFSREAELQMFCDDCDTVFLQSLRADHTLRKVTLTVDRAIGLATATNLANFHIDGLEILSIEPSFLSHDWTRTMTLHTSPQQPGQSYILNVTGLVGVNYPYPEINGWALPFSAFALQPGGVRRERWTNLMGGAVADLTNHVRFPDQPDQIDLLPGLESPQTINPDQDNYGQRLSGFLQVTNTGDYLFAIAADDQAVFYLSTDESPTNKRAVLVEPLWNEARSWNSLERRVGPSTTGFFPEVTTLAVNQSANTVGAIQLVAGGRYYFEVLHKEGGGGDHVAVTMWPAGSPPPANGTPGIPDAMIWNYQPADEAIEIILQPRDQVVRDGYPVSFSVAASSLHSPIQFQWERNGVALPGATQATLRFDAVTGWSNDALIQCRLTAPPVTITSASARLRVIDWHEFRALPLGAGGLNLVWGYEGTPVQLQSTTNLFPTPNWQDRYWNDQRDGLLHFYSHPNEPFAPTQEFYRVVPAE